jgi:hypothetical protein
MTTPGKAVHAGGRAGAVPEAGGGDRPPRAAPGAGGRWPGQYYTTTLARMIEHLDLAERKLAELSRLPVEPRRPGQNSMSLAAMKAKRKRQVIKQLQRAIRDRIAWHRGQIELAADRGFTASADHEPQRRSVKNPRLPAHV